MIREFTEGVHISLHVLPNAPRSEIVGVHNGKLKIKIQAPPVDGKANDAIISFFSEFFDIAKSRCEILRGSTGKSKMLLLRGMTAQGVLSRLQRNNN